MPERSQSLIRTRCPECATIFRVTSVQLRQKAGTVRCGHCQALFNAFDHLLRQQEAPAQAAPSPALAAPQTELAPPQDMPAQLTSLPCSSTQPEPALAVVEPFLATPPEDPVSVGEPGEVLPATDTFPEGVTEDFPLSALDGPLSAAPEEACPAPAIPEGQEAGTPDAEPPAALAEKEQIPSQPASPEADAPVAGEMPETSAELHRVAETSSAEEQTTAETTQAARDAGLVAARELVDTASYNRWSEGVLAGNGIDHSLEQAPVATKRWPYMVLAVILSVVLLAQLSFYFRSEIVVRWPAFSAIYQSLAVDVPLPENADQVTIEASDLQSDPARSLFILQATVKNRAAYAQAWPALELTLTDINEAVVARRVIDAVDYLPPDALGQAFEANSERVVRLSIEAKDLGASGYRLYLFYH